MPSGKQLSFELRAIGAGTFGTVYPGTFSDVPVAVKFVRCSLEFTPCLLHEVAVLSSLSHPNIIPLLESMVQTDSAVAVSIHIMPRADGSVQQRLDQRLALAPRRAAADLYAALDYMHAAGWVHSDVTTMNVLIIGERYVLADFGVTCARGTPRAANAVTNEGCRPPEYYVDHVADFPADVWSAACVVAEMCCGIPVMFHTTLSGPLAHKIAFADTFQHGCVTLTDDSALQQLFVRVFRPNPAERITSKEALSLFYEQ